MDEPRWLMRVLVEAIHHGQISEHGGLQGLRDEGALESALSRPLQKWTYESEPDVPGLAAGETSEDELAAWIRGRVEGASER